MQYLNRPSLTGTSVDGSPYIYPVLTPRFAISTTEQLITSVGQLAASDPSLAIQTHISENPSEVEYTKNLFSHLSKEGKPITYAGVYDHYGLLRDNTILAHAVHLEEEELELVKERRSGISHCPTSNFNLTSGVAKVGLMLDKEIKVGHPSHKAVEVPEFSPPAGWPWNRFLWRILAFNSHDHPTRVDRSQGRSYHIAH